MEFHVFDMDEKEDLNSTLSRIRDALELHHRAHTLMIQTVKIMDPIFVSDIIEFL